MDVDNNLKIDLELPFATERIAEIVYDVLRVDGEPKRSGVVKVLSLESKTVKVTFSASLARQLRIALNNFFVKVDLITETIQEMGPPVSDHYDHY